MAGINVASYGGQRKACSVDGCGRPALRKSYCRGHYKRWRKRGDVCAGVPLQDENRRPLEEKTCEQCGQAFARRSTGRDAGRFCSRECGFEAQRLAKARRGLLLLLNKVRACDICGKSHTRRAVTCSQECARDRHRQYARSAAKLRSEAAFVSAPLDCVECGKRFMTEYGEKKRKFCSTECRKRHFKRISRKAEKARLRGVRVERRLSPIRVFERDGWRCQLCGKMTLRSKRGLPHPRAPELDHIIPLAQGGEHSYRNVQCACRACNGAKADGPGGQLLLFGAVA